MYTADDVGPRFVDGETIELSNANKQAIAEAWNMGAETNPQEWRAIVAATRYAHEIAGTTFTHSDGNTYGVATDRQSQALVTGAAVQVQRTGENKRWKTAQGFVTLTPDDVLALGDAVDSHVQAAFDREAELLDKVADGSISEADLETAWPT